MATLLPNRNSQIHVSVFAAIYRWIGGDKVLNEIDIHALVEAWDIVDQVDGPPGQEEARRHHGCLGHRTGHAGEVGLDAPLPQVRSFLPGGLRLQIVTQLPVLSFSAANGQGSQRERQCNR
ncbi:MAG: hypothetical protein NTX45_00470 [Proteobacteria bacterium]|nr:hypothetical protein [Pseudomonadota bacterium]